MIRRTFLVPIRQLDQTHKVELVEIIAEPCRQHQATFSALSGLGLDRAIGRARQALRYLQKPRQASALYWTNPGFALTQPEGVSLTLALGAWAMDQAHGYERIIVLGQLATANDVVDNGLLEPIINTIKQLQIISTPTCLIMPKSVSTDKAQEVAIVQLQALNIDVYPVTNLPEAIQVCFAESYSQNETITTHCYHPAGR